MKDNKKLFIDIHAIQTLPPSNINRDDTGSPKTAQYGGVRRTRVSSQSWKRAIRQYFLSNGEQSNVGVRTLNIAEYVARKIKKLDDSKTEQEALALATKIFDSAGVKLKDSKAKALFFLGDAQAEALAQAALKNVTDKASLHTILNNNPAIDIALFGRMVADDPSLNEDASSQVAHAISTHAVQTEFDFFTAIDDLAPEDNAGAGMLGTVEFNSSTLYRYANVAIHDLHRQLVDKTATVHAVSLFIEAFVKSLPTGKVNTFANQTLPQALVVSIRGDRPINLVSAFEKPVKSMNGYVEPSIVNLSKEIQKVTKFADEALDTFYVSTEEMHSLNQVGTEQASLKILLASVENKLEELM